MVFGIKSFLIEDYNRTYQKMIFKNSIDINYQFENLCFTKLPDFNLLFVTSILGNLLLKWADIKKIIINFYGNKFICYYNL